MIGVSVFGSRSTCPDCGGGGEGGGGGGWIPLPNTVNRSVHVCSPDEGVTMDTFSWTYPNGRSLVLLWVMSLTKESEHLASHRLSVEIPRAERLLDVTIVTEVLESSCRNRIELLHKHKQLHDWRQMVRGCVSLTSVLQIFGGDCCQHV